MTHGLSNGETVETALDHVDGEAAKRVLARGEKLVPLDEVRRLLDLSKEPFSPYQKELDEAVDHYAKIASSNPDDFEAFRLALWLDELYLARYGSQTPALQDSNLTDAHNASPQDGIKVELGMILKHRLNTSRYRVSEVRDTFAHLTPIDREGVNTTSAGVLLAEVIKGRVCGQDFEVEATSTPVAVPLT